MEDVYKVGDRVIVELPNGSVPGVIFAILPNYAWSKETKYEIHGKDLLTITSERCIRRAEVEKDCAKILAVVS